MTIAAPPGVNPKDPRNQISQLQKQLKLLDEEKSELEKRSAEISKMVEENEGRKAR